MLIHHFLIVGLGSNVETNFFVFINSYFRVYFFP
jgi:hypothetical protein